jgi:prepilin-type N-terminal cleavage/methylation domain-containing protein
MSPTNANSRRHGAIAGFTLVEMIVAMGLSAIIFAGILSGYTFLARNFTRLLNTQGQDTKSRRAVYVFTQDVSKAINVFHPLDPAINVPHPLDPLPSPTLGLDDATLKLALPDGNSTKVVSYVFDPTSRSLLRTENGNTTVLLADLTSFGGSVEDRPHFRYFDKTGNSTVAPVSVKEIELKFTSSVGNPASGTAARYTAVSPRLVLRNKSLLQ